MYSVTLFAEDAFHEDFLIALLGRLSDEYRIETSPRSYSARGGITRMHHELGEFLRDLQRDAEGLPDVILAATDANCMGYLQKKSVLEDVLRKFDQFEYLMVYAIPDPHIERWAMIDPEAFRAVFGRGCTLPALKCERALYKDLLAREIIDSGVRPALGGREYVREIVSRMNLPRCAGAEPSFGHLLTQLKTFFNRWRQDRPDMRPVGING